MTASRIATIVVGFVLSATPGAFAQEREIERDNSFRSERRIDPLDVVAQTERIAATVSPSIDSRSSLSGADYERYLQVYQQYLVEYTRFNQTAQRRPIEKKTKGDKPSVAGVLRNISGTLAVADQGLDVYGHALELQAYKNSLVQQR